MRSNYDIPGTLGIVTILLITGIILGHAFIAWQFHSMQRLDSATVSRINGWSPDNPQRRHKSAGQLTDIFLLSAICGYVPRIIPDRQNALVTEALGRSSGSE